MSKILTALPWKYDDGGRAETGYKGTARDCVARAWAIALERPYQEVYDELSEAYKARVARMRGRNRERHMKRTQSARNGLPTVVLHDYAEAQGWHWTPTMAIGTGTTHHLAEGELPTGRIIARVSGHVCAVIDGIIHDTYDPTRDGTRAVYGYWTPST